MKNLVLGVLVDLCENPKVCNIIYYENATTIALIWMWFRLFHMWQRGEHLISVLCGLSLHDSGEMKSRRWKCQEGQ